MRTISSQRYRNPAIVAEKSAAGDYEVQFVVVEVDGEEFRVIVDGHHSHAAALAAGVEPSWERATEAQREADRMGAAEWLAAHQDTDDYYDVSNGFPVF